MTRRGEAALEIKRSVEIRHPCNGRRFGARHVVAYILLPTPAYIMPIKRAATVTGFSGCDWLHGRWRAAKHLAARPIFIPCRWTIGLPGISWRRIRRSVVLFDSCARVGVLLIAPSAASRGWFHVSSRHLHHRRWNSHTVPASVCHRHLSNDDATAAHTQIKRSSVAGRAINLAMRIIVSSSSATRTSYPGPVAW